MARADSQFSLSGKCSEALNGASCQNSSTSSALNAGVVLESCNVDEDKDLASKAVMYVIRGTRKGIIPLCSDVAELMKSKLRLERMVQAQQMEINRLQRAASAIPDLPVRCISPSSEPGLQDPHAPSPLKLASTQTVVAICHRNGSEDIPPPRFVRTKFSPDGQILQVKPASVHVTPGLQPADLASFSQASAPESAGPDEPVSAVTGPVPLSADTMDSAEAMSVSVEPASVMADPMTCGSESVMVQAELAEEEQREKSKTMVSREVQVEHPHLLMQREFEDQLMDTLLLNSQLSKDLEKAWQEIGALKNRLCKTEEQWCQQQQAGTEQTSFLLPRSGSDRQDQPLQKQHRHMATIITPPTLSHSLSQICDSPGDVDSPGLSTEQCFLEESPVTSPQENNMASCTLFPFPMIGCKCTSCLSFFGGCSHKEWGQGFERTKDFKSLQRLLSKKVHVNLQDYVILNGSQSGKVHYVGHLDNCGVANAVFIGLELDEPSGTHDGVFKGKRYYQCFQGCGLFAPIHEVYYRIRQKQKTAPSQTPQSLRLHPPDSPSPPTPHTGEAGNQKERRGLAGTPAKKGVPRTDGREKATTESPHLGPLATSRTVKTTKLKPLVAGEGPHRAKKLAW